jgi:hypothetical protein
LQKSEKKIHYKFDVNPNISILKALIELMYKHTTYYILIIYFESCKEATTTITKNSIGKILSEKFLFFD